MQTELIAMAERLGARLCRDAIWSNGQCNWTADFLEDKQIGHRALGGSLYDGTAGIALFLHHLGAKTGERMFRLTADAALEQALAHSGQLGPGLYPGALGVLFAQLQIRGEMSHGELLRHTELQRDNLDLLYGSAGAIAALLAAYVYSRDDCLLERAMQHGDLILTEASRTEAGMSWNTFQGRAPLTGFSHGAAGIGWALLHVYRVTAESCFREAARDAFRYEQSVFDAAAGNWPDFRTEPAGRMTAWCHGAAGIALSRLDAWRILREPEWCLQAETALSTVVKNTPLLGNCSLCHGVAGNADILITASVALERSDLYTAAQDFALEAFDRFEKRRLPWPCGLPGGHEMPDLMLGLAGIGLLYLRLADPAVPSPLLPAAAGCARMQPKDTP